MSGEAGARHRDDFLSTFYLAVTAPVAVAPHERVDVGARGDSGNLAS